MDDRKYRGNTKFLIDKIRDELTRRGCESRHLSEDEVVDRCLRMKLRAMGVPASDYASPPGRN